MYHRVSLAPDAGDYFAISRRQFAHHLDLLRTTGLRGVSLEQAVDRPNHGTVAITFDDGDESHFRHALPELLSRGMTATFFVITGRVGMPGYVTWDQLRAMSRAGMSIQSHTHTHPYLSELDEDAVARELVESRRLLDVALAQRTMTLSLPNGDAPRSWGMAEYRGLGYSRIATSRWGSNQGTRARFIRRYTVRRDTSDATFLRLIAASSSAYSMEGLRLLALARVRAALGPSRYAVARRRVLAALGS
jgi:peptidoglycan/xylan/chitin deacetylase (PgdA/CDA1 family)